MQAKEEVSVGMQDENAARTREGIAIAERIPVAGMRRMMAEHMIKSHTSTARVTILEEANVGGLVRLRSDLLQDTERTAGVRISYTHLFIKALAQSLRQHPAMNSTLVEKEILVLEDINIGMAVALPDGNLIVPVIHQADKLNIIQIARRATEVQEKATQKKLVFEDVQKGTFTLTNVGMLPESRWTTPIINQGQCAILGTGAIRKAPVVREDRIEVGFVMSLSLTFDHRVVNGLPASLFLQALGGLLSHPAGLELGV